MSALTTPLGFIGLLSILFMLYILANLSRRLGSVTKMKPYYWGFYVAMGLIAVAIIARIIQSSLQLSSGVEPYPPGLYLLAYHLPLALAVTLGAVIAWRYWGWLFRESWP
ncbi:MAG: hypothetical protein JW850_08235 [Thermoflexales bacterium]|nr:hypothetical protein [Thermoflexales bacterium]